MATRTTLHVEVVTAERELYSGEANEVNAPGSEGRMGILPRHAALLTALAPGQLVVKLNGAEDTLFVSGGFMEVSNNNVTVLADAAEYGEEIDETRAQEARRRTEERLAQTQDNAERAELEAALQRAMARLRVVELSRRRGGRRIQMPHSEE